MSAELVIIARNKQFKGRPSVPKLFSKIKMKQKNFTKTLPFLGNEESCSQYCKTEKHKQL